MITIYSKILDVPFDENYRENLYSSLVDRHKKTYYQFPKEMLLKEEFDIFKFLNDNKKLFITPGYNFQLSDDYDAFTKYLYKEFYDASCKIFGEVVLNDLNHLKCFPYVTNNIDYEGAIHNHKKTSVINGVFYLKVPCQDSGELNFYDNHKNLIYSHYPKENELLIFPSYLNHYPQRSNSDIYRIAINIEFVVSSRMDIPTEYKIQLVNL